MSRSAPKIEVVCKQCKMPFKTWNYKLKSGRGKFCSKICLYESRKIKKPIRICKQCGKEFEARQELINYGREPKFCSQKCSHESQKKRIETSCSWCGTKIYERPSKINNVNDIFCSKDCYKKWSSHKMSGSNNHSWMGGISYEPYCILFNNEFKERVRTFFKHKCVECGKPQENKKLHVHHVNYHKDSCCDKNIIPLFVALCHQCHTATNFNREYWEKRFTKLINEKYGGKCYLPKVIA